MSDLQPAPAPYLTSLPLAAVLLVAAGLILWNLDGQHLWQDEAQTALLSRTVLTHGVPVGFDGRHYLSQEQGAEYGPGYVWRWHTWLPFYVLAAFFAVCGESTFVARLPFALFGIGTVAATYGLALHLWRDRRAAFAAALILSLCVPFLILMRQCRWYSPAAFFAMMSLIGYWRLVEGKRLAGPLFASGVVMLFHTHYVYLGALAPSLLLHLAIWKRNRLLGLIGWGGAAALLCTPWILWLSGMQYGRQYGEHLFSASVTWRHLTAYSSKLIEHLFPLALFQVPVLLLVIHVLKGTESKCRERELWRGVSLILLVLCSTVLLLSFVGPAPFFRYLAPLLPLVALLIGRMIVAAMQIHWLLGLVVVVLAVLHYPIRDYLHEITHDFDGPIEGIVTFLKQRSSPDDTVAVTYGDMPIKFYTGLRVIGGLTGEDLAPAEDAEWIIVRRNVVGGDKETRVREFLADQLHRGEYEQIVLDYPDTPFENSEEPSAHLFRTAEAVEPVRIWRKVK